jgi:F-type H+-transporting ATPase subunit epsilon
MLHLEVITPSGSVLSTTVEQVTAPGVEGEFQVLPAHLPALVILGGGKLSYTSKSESKAIYLRGGVAEVSQGEDNPAEGRVLILAEETQTSDSLDKERAQQLKEAAEAMYSNTDYITDAKLARIRQDIDFAEAILGA